MLQIASLKNALAKKEAEVEQRMRTGVSPITRDSRSSAERQRMRAGFSPMHPRMQTMGDVQSHVNRRQPMEDVVNIDVRGEKFITCNCHLIKISYLGSLC
jgi:hypothetical protein